MAFRGILESFDEKQIGKLNFVRTLGNKYFSLLIYLFLIDHFILIILIFLLLLWRNQMFAKYLWHKKN